MNTLNGYSKSTLTDLFALTASGGHFPIHDGRNNAANKLVRTDANGCLNAGWINTTSGAFTGTPNRIYASSDAYIRYMTPANFFPTLANDNNQLSITVAGQNRKLTVGYANNSDKLDGYHLASFGHYTNSKSVTNSSGSTWYAKVVLNMNWNSTTHYIYCLPSYNNINGWFILEIPTWDSSVGYIAKTSDYNGCNIQAFYYCRESDKLTVYLQLVGNSAANCTVYSTATISSLTSVSAPSYSFVSVSGRSFVTNYAVTLSNRLYLNEWIQFNKATGLYWPNTNDAHFYPNETSTYGQFQLLGNKGSYSGIHFGNSKNYLTVMSTDTHHGLYCENNGWEFYYNRSNTYVGLRTSSTPYPISMNGDSYTNGWHRAASGFYIEGTGVHYTSQGSVGEINLILNNEFVYSTSNGTLYFNYRGASRGTTVTNYIWNAGSSSSYASHTLGNLTTRGTIFVNTSDATLKMYSGRITDAKSDGNICLQTSIDGTDGQSHAYPTQYGSRCNLVLQPRGGQVYIGTNPDGGNANYKLYVNGAIYGTSFAGSAKNISTISMTGGDGNTTGYRLMYTWSLSAWSNYRMVFAVASRHTGSGIISIECSCNSATLNYTNVTAQIHYFGNYGNVSIMTSDAFQIFVSDDGSKAYLFWKYHDYNSTSIIPLINATSLDNGTWITTIDATTYGTIKAATIINPTIVGTSDSNSNYRMVFNSENFLYNTAGIYCNPSTDYLYASSMQTSNWFRSTGNTGWYNDTHGGGIYMTDSSWIRNYNSKPLYISVSTYPSLVCNAQGGSQSNIRFEIAGANKGYTGYKTGYGTFLWNSTASKYVYIADNGHFYTQSYINVGAGNEKNASNPPYVWGVNGSDNFLRTYATSSLSVNYANSAGWANSSANADGLASTGYGNGNFTYYQTNNDFFGNSGWSHYLIANHGDGKTYYNFTIGLPFWGVPIYKRLEGGTADGWHTFITSENISSQSVNYANSSGYATSAGSATTASHVKSFLSDITNTSRDANSPTQPIMRHYGSTGYSISNMPTGWTYGSVLTIETAQNSALNSNLNIQLAWDVRHNVNNVAGYLWMRTKDEIRGYRSWERLALMSDLSSYLPLSGGTMAGCITTKTGSSTGIKVGDTYITSVSGELLLQNNSAIRFGGADWDWNVWAGLKYVHSSKIIYLGLADNNAFTANSAQSGGKIYFPGISNLYTGNGSNLIWHAGNDGSGSGLDADLLDGYHASGIWEYGTSLSPYNASSTGWYLFLTLVGTTNDGQVDFVVSAAETGNNLGVADYFHFATRPSSTSRSFVYAHLGVNNDYLRDNIYVYTDDNKTYRFYMKYTSAGTWNWFGKIKHISSRGCTLTYSNTWQTATPSGTAYQATFSGAVSYATSSGSANSVAWGNITGKPSSYYSLPLAANGTRGGIQIGYTDSGANIALKLSSEKGYVTLTKTAVTTALGYTPPTSDTNTWRPLSFNGTSYSGSGVNFAGGTGISLSVGTADSGGQSTVTISPLLPKSGSWFNDGLVKVSTSGVAEIGRYIDFHPTNTSTLDYSVRIDSGTSTTARTFTLGTTGGTFAITADNNKTGNTTTTSKIYPVGTTSTSTTTGNYAQTYTNINFYVNSSGVFWTSDRKFKECIKSPVKNGMLDDETGLIRKFNWKDTGKASYGFIAQELMLHIPEAVDYDETLNKYSVNYDVAHSALIAQLVIKVKELESEISKLKQLIN